jgi:membrane protease YdiL (CAAX protease family)
LERPASGLFTLKASASGLGLFCLLLRGVVSIARIGERLSLAQMGFGRTSWRSAPSAVLLALFFIFIFGPLAGAALAHVAPSAFDDGKRALARLPVWYVGVTIIIVAAGEEWLYRGYAIERLEALTGSTPAAGIVSLLMFGIAHLPLWGLAAALSTLASGAIFTALYIWRRDIVALAAAHVLVDRYGLMAIPMGRPAT